MKRLWKCPSVFCECVRNCSTKARRTDRDLGGIVCLNICSYNLLISSFLGVPEEEHAVNKTKAPKSPFKCVTVTWRSDYEEYVMDVANCCEAVPELENCFKLKLQISYEVYILYYVFFLQTNPIFVCFYYRKLRGPSQCELYADAVPDVVETR